MRLIRPGTPAPQAKGERASRGKSPKETETVETKAAREVWDDYGELKKARRKKEYERSDSPRTTLRPVRSALNFGGGEKQVAAVEEPLSSEPRSLPERDYTPLEMRLSYTFSDRDLMKRALTHRSALGGKERTDYERLEFLGDAVLDLSIAHLLCEKYPDAKEGELSKMRAALVNTQALAAVARHLEIGPFIFLGRGETSSGGQERPSILADVVEALFGAIYHDSSYERVFQSVQTVFGELLEQVQPSDPKTELQEALHAAGSEPPTYLLEHVEGPEHAPTFVTVVIVDGEVAGRGRGNTKKGAQQAAAAEALQKMTWATPPVALEQGQDFILERGLLTAAEVPASAAAESNSVLDEEPQPSEQ